MDTFVEKIPFFLVSWMLAILLTATVSAFFIPEDREHVWIGVPAPRDDLECFRYLDENIVCIPASTNKE
jgi:hypothetical protein